MRLSKRKRPTGAKMDMTPMIDITFLLLIFFISVTQVSKSERLALELPKAKGQENEEPTTLTINVDQQGDIYITGERVDLRRMATLVDHELRLVGNNASQLKIVVRADRRGTSETVNEVVTSLADMGLLQIKIAVETTEY
ncbi:MAG: biopolymer transporter ExbD [Pirellulaceae bacterium]